MSVSGKKASTEVSGYQETDLKPSMVLSKRFVGFVGMKLQILGGEVSKAGISDSFKDLGLKSS